MTQALAHGSPKIALNREHYDAVARGDKDIPPMMPTSFGS